VVVFALAMIQRGGCNNPPSANRRAFGGLRRGRSQRRSFARSNWSDLGIKTKRIYSSFDQATRKLRTINTGCPTPEGSHIVARVSKLILRLSEKSSVDPWKAPFHSKVLGAKRPGSARKKNEKRFAW
jgi:hypothetical protein